MVNPGHERRGGYGGYKRRREEDEDASIRPKGPDAVLASAIKLCRKSTVRMSPLCLDPSYHPLSVKIVQAPLRCRISLDTFCQPLAV